MSTEYIIKVTAEDIQLLGAGLGRLPFDSVVNLMDKLRAQILAQINTVSNSVE